MTMDVTNSYFVQSVKAKRMLLSQTILLFAICGVPQKETTLLRNNLKMDMIHIRNKFRNSIFKKYSGD